MGSSLAHLRHPTSAHLTADEILIARNYYEKMHPWQLQAIIDNADEYIERQRLNRHQQHLWGRLQKFNANLLSRDTTLVVIQHIMADDDFVHKIERLDIELCHNDRDCPRLIPKKLQSRLKMYLRTEYPYHHHHRHHRHRRRHRHHYHRHKPKKHTFGQSVKSGYEKVKNYGKRAYHGISEFFRNYGKKHHHEMHHHYLGRREHDRNHGRNGGRGHNGSHHHRHRHENRRQLVGDYGFGDFDVLKSDDNLAVYDTYGVLDYDIYPRGMGIDNGYEDDVGYIGHMANDQMLVISLPLAFIFMLIFIFCCIVLLLLLSGYKATKSRLKLVDNTARYQ